MPLIVKLVLILSSGMPSNRTSASARVSTATPTRPTSSLTSGSSESKPHCVGRSSATDRPGSALVEQVAVATVGLLGRSEARVLSECPQLAAVSAREVAAGERIGARRRRFTGPVARPVDGLQRDAGGGLNWVGHQWITYLQKMRMPIPHDGNAHGDRPCGDDWKPGEDPVHSDYGTCVK